MLANKLLAMGLFNPMISWIVSYLTSRHQLVRLHSTYSNIESSSTGAPKEPS
ncbi:hypothetical protein HOLleu_36898 [Holothuria leucospilota]|uniref:Uncharacterized protein n=1 Tax=Holothuria leucospilota TaxID=206669 RepID=A0A9Q1BFZ8_HOLLE|nr:hypothetical protein HOLleu_36898 [Holothuria leucospilota]